VQAANKGVPFHFPSGSISIIISCRNKPFCY